MARCEDLRPASGTAVRASKIVTDIARLQPKREPKIIVEHGIFSKVARAFSDCCEVH